jgi:hypothetical protein
MRLQDLVRGSAEPRLLEWSGAASMIQSCMRHGWAAFGFCLLRPALARPLLVFHPPFLGVRPCGKPEPGFPRPKEAESRLRWILSPYPLIRRCVISHSRLLELD